ncbi:AEC family transporter [Desulfurobacterium thermolithotrophum]|uniref:AEC family transporter n=1 Tax=Desulfurobacterium thermolithotrophum TaxID=64160 RepID=UPI0013D8B254|nr:AEC family transporter [Desulfurobacterium thermolithotrophum]
MGNVILNVILPLYLLIFSGFLIGKLNPKLKTDTISFIVLYLFAPALIFTSFRNIEISLHNLSCITFTALGVFLGVLFLSLIVETFFLKRKNEAFEISSTVMNAGYLGIPLIYLMFGDNGIPYAITFMVVMAVLHFTLGIFILQRENLKEGLISVLKIPLIYAVIFAFFTKDVFIPQGIEKVIKLAGDATLPLMLVSIGISLSRIKPSEFAFSFWGTVLRFLGGFFTAVFFTALFNCPNLIKKVLIVQSSLPSAILNYVLCERFNKSPEVAASIIFVSTLLFPIWLIILGIFV